MPRKKMSPYRDRERAPEEMFVNTEATSVRRGRRIAPRTEVCRPCLVWLSEASEEVYQGVLLDLNPYGMRVRMIDTLENGASVQVQMMRDDDFQIPLSPPIEAQVIRSESGYGGLIDHGLKRVIKRIRRPDEGRPVRPERPSMHRRPTTRMHTLDITTDDLGYGRRGRGRG